MDMHLPPRAMFAFASPRRWLAVMLGASVLSNASAEPYWQRAGECLRAGNYGEAYTEAQAALKDRPNDSVLLRISGVCLIEMDRAQEATATLRRALKIEPDSVASRYYLAQALAVQGSLTEAIQLLDEVIARAPESEYARLAHGVLPDLNATVATTAAVPKTRRWNVYGRFSEEYDDNVTLRAKDDPNLDAVKSWREVYSGYVELRPLDEALQPTPFTLGVGYSIYATKHHEEEVRDYDVFSQNGSVFLSRNRQMGSKPYTARIYGDFTDTELGEEAYSKIFEAGVTVDYQWFRSGVVSPGFTWQSQDFEDDTEYPDYFSRDGNDYRASLRHDLYLARGNVILGVAYAYHWNDTDGRQFQLESNDFEGSLKLSLPLGLRFYGTVEYREEDYTDFTPEPKRLDDIWTYYAALSQRLWKDAARAEIHYTHEASNSNLDFSDYERNVVGFALSLSL
jgi:tetratricopeptide (TPR) repeat protein